MISPRVSPPGDLGGAERPESLAPSPPSVKETAGMRPTADPWGWKGPAPGFQGWYWPQWQLNEKTLLCRLGGHPSVMAQPVGKEKILPWDIQWETSRRAFC